jgi:hypothetical protein
MKKQAARRQSARIKLSADKPDPSSVEANGKLDLKVSPDSLETPPVNGAQVIQPQENLSQLAQSQVTQPQVFQPQLTQQTVQAKSETELEARVRARVEKLVDFLGDDKHELWRWAAGIGAMTMLIAAPKPPLTLLLILAIWSACYFAYKSPENFLKFWTRMYQVFFNWSTLFKVAIAYFAALFLQSELTYLPYALDWLPKNRALINPDFLWQKIAILSALVGATLFAYKSLAHRLGASNRINLTYSLLLLVGAGLCSLFAGIPFTTFGVADLINNWLAYSATDANIGTITVYGHPYPPFKFFVALVLYYAFSKPITYLARKIALNLESGKYRRYAKSVLQTASQSINKTKLNLTVRAAHPVLKHCFQAALWLTFCYFILFSLVSSNWNGLGLALARWLQFSFDEAHLRHGVFPHAQILAQPKLLQFLASVIALWGAAPLAVTLATFLPPTKSGEIEVRAWGLYRKRFHSMLPFSNPLHLWQDLSSVCLKEAANAKARVVILKFSDGVVYKLSSSQVDEREMQILLETIDKCAPNCKIEPALLQYRADLQAKYQASADEDTSHNRVSQRKFNATVFKPYNPGELIDSSLRIVRMLGSKPLSAVYLVRTDEGKLSVLKQFSIAAQNQSLEKLVKDFERECKLLEALDNPGISKVYRTFRQGDSQFLLLEYKTGKDLFHLVSEAEPLDEHSVREIAHDIASLMLTLHNHQPAIIHRDLTPDNIVLTTEGKIALIDFGSAHQFAEGITGTLVGKQAYIAPEQLRGKATKQSDIYSFGSCLNYLLTGKEPRALSQSDPQKGGLAISDNLNDLIKQCTDYDADKRPPSFEAILSYLETDTGNRPTEAKH